MITINLVNLTQLLGLNAIKFDSLRQIFFIYVKLSHKRLHKQSLAFTLFGKNPM